MAIQVIIIANLLIAESIVLSPPSLLVPVETTDISFLCEINVTAPIYWREDGKLLIQDNSILEIDERANNNQSRLRIVNAVYDLNNATFDCFIELYDQPRVYSNEVTLLVINGNNFIDLIIISYYDKYYHFRNI
jgi:hypothetical protein